MKVHSIAISLGVATLHGEVSMVASLGAASPCCGWFPGVRIMLAEAPCQVATLCTSRCTTLHYDFSKYNSSKFDTNYLYR